MRQRGFSLVEGLLIVLVITIVGAGGWYVISRNSDTDKTTSESILQIEPQSNSETGPTDISSQLSETLVSENMGFSLNYTKNNGCKASFSEFSTDDIIYKQGNRGFSNVTCSVDNNSYAKLLNIYISLKDSTMDKNLLESESAKLQKTPGYESALESEYELNGIKGTEWVYISNNNGPSIYSYYFQKDDLTYIITINEDGLDHNEYDYTKRGLDIFNTITFL